ncbi:hypothetical protein ZWY2020_048622 [Hordeum vulgare]|nr:hypothetical protein ZWY2020_048622 [Hordeum vulgare]
MATDAILETIKPRRSPWLEDLPVTNGGGGAAKGAKVDLSGMRRRVSSSLSLSLQPLSSSSSAAFRRARSMPSIKALAAAGAVRQWWEWGLGWVMTRKPSFARGLEMNDEEAAVLGCHCRGTLRHVFYKARAEVPPPRPRRPPARRRRRAGLQIWFLFWFWFWVPFFAAVHGATREQLLIARPGSSSSSSPGRVPEVFPFGFGANRSGR